MAAKNPPDQQGPQPYAQGPPSQSDAQRAAADLVELIRRLSAAGGVPVSLSAAPLTKIDTADRLNRQPRLTVAFPQCANELLALYKTTDTDEVTGFFTEYFKFLEHRIFGQRITAGRPEDVKSVGELDQLVGAELDDALENCLSPDIILRRQQGRDAFGASAWPSECCICTPCVTLDGKRNPPPKPFPTVPGYKRLWLGDVVWLFFFERMGIHQILGAILDAFAYNGRLPISNGSIESGVRDDITALVLEVMVRQTKMGLSSTTRDRGALYRTSLGWKSPAGAALRLDTEVNTGFNALFHKLIYNALEFYKDKRLAVAIQGTAAGTAPPSVATLTTISDTIDILKKRFEPFQYGRNYYNALSGILWTIAGMSIIRELRGTLGIPTAFESPHEFIPAAYDLLVLKRPVTSGDTNRFLVHRDCGRNGRDLLLDLEVIDHTQRDPGGELEQWLTQVEAKVEAYRTAYRTLTGVDLGASATPAIEQQA